MAMRKPTQLEFLEYDGAHCFQLWKILPAEWRCPGCDRSKFEVLRWTKRYFKLGVGKCPAYMGWMAGLHRHHDHAQGYVDQGLGRFPETVICDQCNSSDGTAKRRLSLPQNFSFSPSEIREFITATPHGRHSLDLQRAKNLYQRLGV